ncbi:ABC transporter permease [Nocardia bhagyanarayanae]|uniref:NitT/TauT family transport system permease protein/sulfonate transport system permease protein n=1 Tax=Nocardia bhagyanarayanae TaxID=1215925 RepID=A0A543FH89_9NOCA|nr:ABC transporter permease [Nocardia bhagyanarayanae]TQM33217.1 NitT/TauT family transport system permease protein/sulfonate transport system permease protein [Nocardia bhagyanarayanae]
MSSSSPPVVAKSGSTRRRPSSFPAFGRGERVGVALVLPIVSVFGALTIWYALTRFQVFAPALLPSPGEVAGAAAEMAAQGTLVDDALASFRRAASGFIVGSAIAVVVGALTGRSVIARGLLEPLIQLVRPIPAIALVPLAILWFGLGEESKLFLTSLGVFFPVWINTHTGIAATREDHLRVAASVGASRAQVFGSVVLPSALPFVLTGLRQGIAMSLILIVASEQAGVTAGLGFRLDQARLFSQPDRLFACLAALGIVGALADQLFHRATKGFVAWAAEQS